MTEPLRFLERPADGEPTGCWSSITAAGPTSPTCSASPTSSTPSAGSTSPLPGHRSQLPGSPGYHWYLVPRVGYPDPDTFHAARAALSELHDRLWEQTGIGPEATVLGGFSMGSVMSYAMGLGADRPAVAGLLAFSGFIPIVEGWEPHFEDRAGTRVFIAHGESDPIMEIGFARSAREQIEAGGLAVSYHESPVGHQIDPAHVPLAAEWLRATIPAAA